jgi:2-keto-4-pentenoate hydratase
MNFDQKVNYFYSLRTSDFTEQPLDLDFMPNDEEQAYKIQKEVVKKLGFPVVGWKLGGTNSKTQQNFNCKSAYLGPIFSVNQTKPMFPININLRGEAELTFRINERISYLSLVEINVDPLQFFDFLYPSLELPLSKINNFKDVGVLPLIADSCGTGHLSLGEPLPLKALSASGSQVSITSKGNILAIGHTKNLIGGYKAALSDFLKLVLTYDFEVRAGQFVATGGVTDCISITPSTLINIKFEDLGIFSVSFS